MGIERERERGRGKSGKVNGGIDDKSLFLYS